MARRRTTLPDARPLMLAVGSAEPGGGIRHPAYGGVSGIAGGVRDFAAAGTRRARHRPRAAHARADQRRNGSLYAQADLAVVRVLRRPAFWLAVSLSVCTAGDLVVLRQRAEPAAACANVRRRIRFSRIRSAEPAPSRSGIHDRNGRIHKRKDVKAA